MSYKTKEQRKIYYNKHKDEINKRRRTYTSTPAVRKRIRRQDRIWRKNNSQKISALNKVYKKKYDLKIKNSVFDYYGKKCICCGESNLIFLSIDHINGGGTKHRKEIGKKSYVWLYQNNFPDGYQTLCFNCNWGKHLNGGVCPHKINHD